MMKEKKKINFVVLLLVGIMFVLSSNIYVAKASEDDNNEENWETKVYFITNEGEVIYNPDFVVLQNTDDSGNQGRAATKSITQGYTIFQAGVAVCDYVHNITFNYGIPSSSGLIAQITNANAYITYSYPNSSYYGRVISTSITNNADPAIFISYINVYKKSNNSYVGQVVTLTRCYSSGNYN